MHHIDWTIHGIQLRLLADHGLFWADRQTLFAADLHLGKEATFARRQIAVPRGSSLATLQRLSRMLQATAALRLVLLGDLFHERSALAPDIMTHFTAFRRQHHEVAMQLLLGNHDRGVRQVAAPLGLEIREVPAGEGPLTLCHYPEAPAAGRRLTLAGHLHPAIRLPMAEFRGQRARCFYLRSDCLILPAAGEFTGSALVMPSGDDRAAVIVEGQVVQVYPPPSSP